VLPNLSAKVMPEDGPRNDVEVCETTIFVAGRGIADEGVGRRCFCASNGGTDKAQTLWLTARGS
jgi:hypothetical protein